MWNGQIQMILLWHEQRRARACGSSDVCDARETALVLGLKDVDVSFAAADVQPLSSGVIEEIVGVADDVERTGFLTACRVEHEHLCRPPAADKHAMIRLIERHREIRFRTDNGP